MSNTTARHRLNRRGNAIIGTTRKGRITRLASATAVAGLLAGGLTLATVPANAATVTNPNCAVPSSVVFQKTSQSSTNPYSLLPGPLRAVVYITISTWQATYNGKHYTGTTLTRGTGTAAPNTVVAGETITNGNVLSATCKVG